ncbi:MAG: DNA-binding protein [Caldiserica bacterium]|jgi:predicted DNA-binding protein with PD1-like motif|nr:DNA-binding protein [Caldisericota bacterium]
MKDSWELDAQRPDDYHAVECKRGREFILRLTTGADVFLAIQKFARDHNIMYAKIHAAFMGGLQPARFLVWTPDSQNPENWHHETPAVVQNLSMILAIGGMIHPRPGKDGNPEPFPAIHFVAGGAWDCPTFGGHLEQGSIVKGVLECFITEIEGIEVLYPTSWLKGERTDEYPENWYREVK